MNAMKIHFPDDGNTYVKRGKFQSPLPQRIAAIIATLAK